MTCRGIAVRIDEATHSGVIVTALEVIEVGLSVVDVAMMAKMAVFWWFGDCGKGAAQRLIFVSSDHMTIAMDDGHDIALEVCNAAVNRTVMLWCICQSVG